LADGRPDLLRVSCNGKDYSVTGSSDNPERTSGSAPHVFDRRLLQLRRGRAARGSATGDAPDFLLEWVSDDIADRLSVIKRDFSRIVNLGAHTGVLGRMLRARFPSSLVVDADASPEMLAHCGSPRVVVDEEALPFADGALDLVVSGLSLQFVNDLPGALVQIRRSLRPDGLFIGAMLGGSTLRELREALTEAELDVAGGVSPRVAPFADVRDVGALLQRAGFALPVTDADVINVTYATPFDLLRDLRGMGAANALVDRRKHGATRALFMRAAEIYEDRFSNPDGRVRATFEIITMTAWSPDEGQQKPLRPGSAVSRLADALGTAERSAGDKTGR
jgi:SAM-dependent methyltransferase